jgi:hypothetical protein
MVIALVRSPVAPTGSFPGRLIMAGASPPATVTARRTMLRRHLADGEQHFKTAQEADRDSMICG